MAVLSHPKKFWASTRELRIPNDDLALMRWIISMRYKISLALFGVLALIWGGGMVSNQLAFGLLLVIAAYSLMATVYWAVIESAPTSARINAVRAVMLPEKLVICTLAVYLSGGILTPMTLLYPLAIIEAIILTDPVGVYRTGAMAVAFYCTLSVLQINNLIPVVDNEWGGTGLYKPSLLDTYANYTLVVSALILVSTYLSNRIAHVMSRRNKQISTQLHDLSTLYDITKGLGDIQEEDAMLRYLATKLKSVQNAGTCVIGLVNSDNNVEVRASAGVAPGALRQSPTVGADTPILSKVYAEGQPLILSDIDEQTEYKPLLANPNTKCACLFPIKEDGKVVGSISLGFETKQEISPEYISLMTTIGTQAGVALQRVHLFCASQRAADEMSVMYETGLYTGSTLSRDEVLRRTSATIERLMDPDAYYIALYEVDNNMLWFEVFRECGQMMPKMHMPLDRGGLTGRIIESCKPLFVQDWLSDGQQYNTLANKTGADMLSYLGVPMVAEDKVVGVISVQSQRPLAFDAHHERMLVSLAAQAAMALENARLHKLAQDQGKLDSLTKVYNHGMFVDLVRSAVEESDREDKCVALIMLDIDHFKKYNDTYGHVAGDNVLRMIGNALKSSVRETDSVGRWGGEEFCVLLPGAGIQEAKTVARYIRRAIAELYPVDGHGHVIPNPTISQGISCYPFPSLTPSDLIEEADSALYQAKKQGRNQLIVYEGKGFLREATTTTGELHSAVVKDHAHSSIITDPINTHNLVRRQAGNPSGQLKDAFNKP